MNFKNFRVQIILRVVLLFLSIYGLTYYLFVELNEIRVFFLGLSSVLILIWIFSYINKANKDVKNFLQAIIHDDFTIKYNSTKQGRTFDEMYETFNKVNHKFVESTQQDAAEYQYISTLINQLQVGILAFDDRERIQLVNQAFKNLLEIKEIVNLDSLRRELPELYEAIVSAGTKDNTIVKLNLKGRVSRLSLSSTAFKLRGKSFKIISFQDIHAELDQNEMQAWQKLIRVLTHEIMNSVAPITSLSGSLKSIVHQNESIDSQKKTLKEGLDAIENRSQGLMNFTQAYRKLTRIPLPDIKEVNPSAFFSRVESLFRPTLAQSHTSFNVEIDQTSQPIMIDPDLMEQVIINLLKNAKEASIDNGTIRLRYTKNELTQVIEISDSGTGIPEDVQDKIFVPFYTTKEEGSGIGLSLVQQVVRLHNGQIDFETSDEGTTFRISL